MSYIKANLKFKIRFIPSKLSYMYILMHLCIVSTRMYLGVLYNPLKLSISPGYCSQRLI